MSFLSVTYVCIGILAPPQQFLINSTKATLVVSWVAPPSLELSTPPTVSHYELGNNVTNITKTISNPPGCRSAMPCNSSLGLSDPSFVIHFGRYGEQNATILDYNDTIQFIFIAVNGAGRGNTTTFIFIPPKKSLIGWFKKSSVAALVCCMAWCRMLCNFKYCIEQRGTVITFCHVFDLISSPTLYTLLRTANNGVHTHHHTYHEHCWSHDYYWWP